MNPFCCELIGPKFFILSAPRIAKFQIATAWQDQFLIQHPLPPSVDNLLVSHYTISVTFNVKIKFYNSGDSAFQNKRGGGHSKTSKFCFPIYIASTFRNKRTQSIKLTACDKNSRAHTRFFAQDATAEDSKMRLWDAFWPEVLRGPVSVFYDTSSSAHARRLFN